MNALTTSTTFFPSSFQLKFAFYGRKSPLTLVRTRFSELDRRSVSFVSSVVRSSAVNSNGVERRRKSSWTNSNSSNDNFSGWANADGEHQAGDSPRKQSLVGILGAGAAGVLLVAGLTLTALSISSSRNSSSKQQMEPLTVEQEDSLSSDNHQDSVNEEKSEEKLGLLQSGSEENKTGTNGDILLYKENCEPNESELSAGQSSKNDDGSIQEADQNEPTIDGSLVFGEATDKQPASDITDGSLGMQSIQSKNGSTTAESTVEQKSENLVNAKILDPLVFDAKPENLTTDQANGVSGFNVRETPNLLVDPSSVDPSISKISVDPQLDEVVELNIVPGEFVESGRLLSTINVQPGKEFSSMDVDISSDTVFPVDGDDKYPLRENFNGTGSSGVSLVPEVAYQFLNEQLENDYNYINVNRSFFDSTNPGNFFTSAGIPAPSVVSAALQAHPGKVLVPAVVDQLQSQALSALQVLKVIEDDVHPGDLCTRREYARWLVLASSALSRSTTSKVYPAMYIENISELAFDDITPDDPDFPSIQGLAEAGLIASKLSRRDMQLSLDDDTSPLFFSPESPLSRQDLVSWKMALEKRQLPVVDRKTLQQFSGFLDIDKIDQDAWPALVADLAAGEQGIITLAFGYTRLFQPEKPVTKAQAAIALSTGDASAMVSEELARIEAESMAEKAVAAHNALVAQVEKDLNASYENELLLEKEKIDAVEKLAEAARQEVELLRAKREEENLALMKERAAVDSEMEVLSRLRREVEEQLQILMTDKLEVSYEKERLSKLRRDAETENQEIARLQYELEVERKALSMARAWAEDETKRAREQAKALEEARHRWESQGIKVVVENDLREEEDTGVTWLDAGKQFSVEGTIDRSENLVDKLRAMADLVRGKCKNTINKLIEKIVSLIATLKEKSLKVSLQAGELKDSAKSRLDSSLQRMQHSSVEFTSAAKEGVKRVAGDWKEGVERLSQKFKT